jgi:hypothetical protein
MRNTPKYANLSEHFMGADTYSIIENTTGGGTIEFQFQLQRVGTIEAAVPLDAIIEGSGMARQSVRDAPRSTKEQKAMGIGVMIINLCGGVGH